jgi:hypothetical protein
VPFSQSPILDQFVFVYCIPIKDGVESPTWKLAFNDTGVDFHRYALCPVLCMEMRRTVIVVQYVDHDAKKATDFWH